MAQGRPGDLIAPHIDWYGGSIRSSVEAPIHGMLAIEDVLVGQDLAIRYHSQPELESAATLLWNGTAPIACLAVGTETMVGPA